MLTPQELERLPLKAEKLFSELEDRIMLDIVRKIKEFGGISRSVDYRIKRLSDMGLSSQMIKEEIRRLLKLTEKEIDKIYDEAIKEGYVRDEELYTASGKAFVPYEENKEIIELADMIRLQTKDKFTNITNSMGFSVIRSGKREFLPVAEYYQSALDKAVIDISTGSFDYNTVLSRTVKEMTNSGIRTVDFSSGKTDRIEVAARRAVMTGVNQLSAFRTKQIMEELGTDLVEVSWHATARPTHQVWQGRVYRWKEFGESLANSNIISYNNKRLSYATENLQIFAIDPKQFGHKAGRHAQDFGLNPSEENDRKEFERIINDIYDNHTEKRIGNWRGYEEQATFYIKGEDVVVDVNGKFVTILKGGINNARVKNAGQP